MDPLTSVAASGMRSRMESLDLLANNVANASTTGYKADREFYNLYLSQDAGTEGAVTMPVVERPWVDLAQGVLQPTGNALDVALSGCGFFSVAGPHGPLYTRNGNFHLSNGTLVTAEGYAVTGTGGIAITASGRGPLEISADGSVRQDGNLIGQLQVVDFPAGSALAKQGATYFSAADPALRPAPAAGTTVEQGKLEGSNSGTADAAVRLVNVMRQFEMLQKAVSLGADMNKEAIEQVAKVGA
jgi:flagellar basal body rod protein FlgG